MSNAWGYDPRRMLESPFYGRWFCIGDSFKAEFSHKLYAPKKLLKSWSFLSERSTAWCQHPQSIGLGIYLPKLRSPEGQNVNII